MRLWNRLQWTSNIVLVLLLVIGCNNDGLVGDDFTTKVRGTSFFPMSGPRAGGASITIAGENFREGVTVFFGDVQAQQVTIESASSLVVTLPPGEYGPAVVKLGLEGTEAALPQPFRYSASDVVLAFEQDVGTSTYDAAFGSGDFNGDELTDIVVATDGGLDLYLNSASGFEFHSKHNLPVALDFDSRTNPCLLNELDAFKYSLAVVDSNRDGLDDVVVSVYRTQLLYRFEAKPEGGFASAVESPHAGILDECLNRVLEPADLDGDDDIDLLVLNHSADVSNSSKPEELGTIGVIWDFGTANEQFSTFETSLDCTTLHSWSINRGLTPNTARVLCADNELDQSQTLSAVEVSGPGQALLGTSTVVAQNIATRTRYHFVDFERDNDPEVVFVRREQGASPIDFTYNGGIATRVGDSLVTERSFDLNCKSDPTLLAAAVSPDQPSHALFFCPQGLEVQGLLDDSNSESTEHRIDIHGGLFSQILTPDFYNSSADGSPMMPSAQVLDLDSDGWDELLVQRRRGRNLLLYANQTHPGQVPARVSLETTRLSTTLDDGRRIRGYTLESYDNGRRSGPIIDLNGDGTPELVMRTMDLGGNPSVAIGKWVDAAGSFDVDELVLSDRIWSSSQVDLPLLVEDFNGDGEKDILAPFQVWEESGARTFADVAVSNGSGYSVTKQVPLSNRPLERLQRVRVNSSGVIEFVGYALESSSGSVGGHDLVHVISVVAVTGSFEEGYSESELLAENLAIPGGVHELLDLDGDGSLDVLSWDGGVCWGGALDACGADGPLLLFDGGLSPASLRVAYSKKEQTFELFGMGADERSGTWVSLSGRQVDKIEFSLDPSWNLFGRFLQQGNACDLDGDGRGEIMFLSTSASQSGWNVVTMARDAAGEDMQFRELSSNSTLSLAGLTCADFSSRGIDDIVIVAGESSLYDVRNRSQ